MPQISRFYGIIILMNKEALMEVWNRAHSGIPLGTIDPLK